MTRALGDDRKIVGVSALPSLSECRLTGNELCLVLATDGLWDSKNCSGPEIGDVCREFLLAGGGGGIEDRASMEQLCQTIVDRGVKGGASDNISLMLLVFDWSAADRQQATNGTGSGRGHEDNLQDSRSVQWPKDRRMSCFPQDVDRLRVCPEKLGDYLQVHFGNNAKMQAAVDETRHHRDRAKSRHSRSRSLSQGFMHKRFSSPIRSIAVDPPIRDQQSSDSSVEAATKDL